MFCKTCFAEAHFPLPCGVAVESVSTQAFEGYCNNFDSFHVQSRLAKFSLKQLFPQFIGIDENQILKEIQKWPIRTEYIPLYEATDDLVTEADVIAESETESTQDRTRPPLHPKIMRRIYHLVHEIWDYDLSKSISHDSQCTPHEHTKNARMETADKHQAGQAARRKAGYRRWQRIKLERTLNVAEEHKIDLNEDYREQIQTAWELLKVRVEMRCDYTEVTG